MLENLKKPYLILFLVIFGIAALVLAAFVFDRDAGNKVVILAGENPPPRILPPGNEAATDQRQSEAVTEIDLTSAEPGNGTGLRRPSGSPARNGLAFDWRRPLRPEDLSGSDPIDIAFSGDGEDEELESFERKREKAAPGLEFRRLSLQDENGKIPVDGLQKAKRQMDRMRFSQNAKARAARKDPKKVEIAGIEPGAWAWLGPGNVGGRVRAININPSNPLDIIAGSVSGGIWRTSNAGVSWQPVDDFMANLAVSTIVRNPNTSTLLYAGTGEGFGFGDSLGGGGVFQSLDSGSSWTLLASTNPAAPPPVPPAPPCGVGSTPCPVFWKFVNRLAISPDGGTMLAATGIAVATQVSQETINQGGIARSIDGGATWTQITNVIAQDVDFDPSSSLNAIAAELTDCGGPAPSPPCPIAGSVRRSTNGGVTWTAATFNPTIVNANSNFNGRTELAYAASSPNIIYASVNQNLGDIYQSIDGGQNFNRVYPNAGSPTPINLLGGQGWYGNALWVNPVDPTFLLVGGVNMYQSGDSGATFALKNDNRSDSAGHVDHHIFVSNPTFDDNTDKSVYFGNDGGVYRVDDIRNFSRTDGWTELNNNFGVTQFYGGAVSFNGLIFGGTQDNGTVKVARTPDIIPPYNSETWATLSGGDGGYVAADPGDPNFLYGERQNMAIFRSTDGGNSQSLINTGISDTASANFIAPLILDPADPNTLLAGSLNLWRCPNAKAATPTWTIAKCPTAAPNPANQPISAIAVSPTNTDFIVVGHNDGQIYMTLDGNCISDGNCSPQAACPNSPTWTRIDAIPATPGRFVTRLAIDNTKSPNWIYATFGGFSPDNIYRTTDFGATWTDVSGRPPAPGAPNTDLPNVPIRSVIINPAVPDSLYVGTEVGIFASEDAGATWQLPTSGPANVSVDELFWYQGDIIAATHGRGMYKTQVPVIDTTKCGVDTGLSCTGTSCPTGFVACTGSGCTCCKAGDWQCPCSWSNQRVPTANDDAYVACPMTGGGGARNITIAAGGGVTFEGSGSLRAFRDFTNFGFVRVVNPFGASQIAADRHILNLRPGPAVTTAGVIQMPGSINAGGVLTNYGIIAVSQDINAKGYVSDNASTLTMNRLTIEGDVSHLGIVQDNGLATFQSIMDFKSPPGMTSTFSGSGSWRGPRGAILGGSSFRLGSDVAIELVDFRNSGTLDVQGHQLAFTGSSFTNDPGQLSNGLGVVGPGVVNFAPASGNATFVTGRREIPQEVQFTPQLKISSGNVIADGAVSGVVVDPGATMQVEFLNVAGDLTLNGTVAPLGSGVLNFNGSTLTNNGAVGNLFFLNFNRSGSPLTQSIQGTGTWSPQNVQLGLYPPSGSTTTLSLENDITFTTNSFIVSQGSTLGVSFRTLTLAGPTNLVNDGTISGPNGTINMLASGSGGRIGSIPGAVWGSNLRIGAGTVRVNPASSSFILGRNLQIASGATLSMTGPTLSVTGSVGNAGAINMLVGTPFAVFEPRGADFANSGTVSGSGLVVRFGSGAGGPSVHQISGAGSWSAMEQILVNSGSTLSLLSDVTYSGNSLFLLGSLNTGANTLTMPCTTTWGGPGELFGNIRRTNLAACAGPVAFGSPFTTIQFTSGTPPDELTVSVSSTAPFPSAVQRTYLIAPIGGSNYTANLRLHYLDSELNGNPESSLQLWRNDGTSWTAQGATGRNTTENWVEYAGVTQFSPWALSELAPTAAGVSVSGRVVTSFGYGVSRAEVRLVDPAGIARSFLTNTFGYYRFDNVRAGATYVVSVRSRRFSFSSPTQVVFVGDNVDGLNFVADP